MEALRFVKILETTYPTTECNISEDWNLKDLFVTGCPVRHSHCCLTPRCVSRRIVRTYNSSHVAYLDAFYGRECVQTLMF